jgi:hypothetical protein
MTAAIPREAPQSPMTQVHSLLGRQPPNAAQPVRHPRLVAALRQAGAGSFPTPLEPVRIVWGSRCRQFTAQFVTHLAAILSIELAGAKNLFVFALSGIHPEAIAAGASAILAGVSFAGKIFCGNGGLNVAASVDAGGDAGDCIEHFLVPFGGALPRC